LLYPANVDLILILILVLINWVEGVLNFTYVESIWEYVENALLFVPNQALYQAEPQPELESSLWGTRLTRHLLRVF
jgi:hypothetical protein